ncbi:MAG TPA: hypothetical protein DEP65_13655 [Ruminococcus sp.]|nr:hypothetical protein [Ruminococcus sp.]
MILKMLKEMKMEMNGVDVQTQHRAEQEMANKEKKEYAEKNFLPKELKQVLNFISVAFIMWNLATVAMFLKDASTLKIIFNTAIVAVDIAALIFMNQKSKSRQKIGTILFVTYLFLFFVCT